MTPMRAVSEASAAAGPAGGRGAAKFLRLRRCLPVVRLTLCRSISPRPSRPAAISSAGAEAPPVGKKLRLLLALSLRHLHQPLAFLFCFFLPCGEELPPTEAGRSKVASRLLHGPQRELLSFPSQAFPPMALNHGRRCPLWKIQVPSIPVLPLARRGTRTPRRSLEGRSPSGDAPAVDLCRGKQENLAKYETVRREVSQLKIRSRYHARRSLVYWNYDVVGRIGIHGRCQ